jgi:hypothetical protein
VPGIRQTFRRILPGLLTTEAAETRDYTGRGVVFPGSAPPATTGVGARISPRNWGWGGVNIKSCSEARGGKLESGRPGHWDGKEDARLAGLKKARAVAVKIRQGNAAEAYTDSLPSIAALRGEGLSLRDIAAKLNTEGHTTRRGRPWNPVQVARVLERAEA